MQISFYIKNMVLYWPLKKGKGQVIKKLLLLSAIIAGFIILVFNANDKNEVEPISKIKPSEENIKKETQIQQAVIQEPAKQIVKQETPKPKIKPLSVQEKKAKFKKMVLKPIQEVHDQLDKDYHEIIEAIRNGEQKLRIEKLKKTYKVTTDEELLLALKPHPVSVALAQAAMESSWGTSRFFTEANNVFGIWSFNKNEPRIAASGQRGEKTIWLKKYKTIKDSVEDYYKNMGRSFAFKEFRKERIASNNPYILVTKLNKYSEKGPEYGKALSSMISYNKFAKYDAVFFEKPKEIKKPKVETTKNTEEIKETKELPTTIETTKDTEATIEIKKEKES